MVPAPTRGKKAKGLKSAADRFANALSEVMNEMAAEGWEYLRTDTLPAEQRSGLTGRTTVFQNMLVFRRPADSAAGAHAPEVTALDAAPEPTALPKLPPADEAQAVPRHSSKTSLFSDGKREVAAE